MNLPSLACGAVIFVAAIRCATNEAIFVVFTEHCAGLSHSMEVVPHMTDGNGHVEQLRAMLEFGQEVAFFAEDEQFESQALPRVGAIPVVDHNRAMDAGIIARLALGNFGCLHQLRDIAPLLRLAVVVVSEGLWCLKRVLPGQLKSIEEAIWAPDWILHQNQSLWANLLGNDDDDDDDRSS